MANRRERALNIAKELAAKHHVTAEGILGRSRLQPLPELRHEVMAALWLSGITIADVGRVMGRDHTSVLHGVRKALGPEAYAKETPGKGRLR
jgi:chromosomal replication initiation ATPase DnaA